MFKFQHARLCWQLWTSVVGTNMSILIVNDSSYQHGIYKPVTNGNASNRKCRTTKNILYILTNNIISTHLAGMNRYVIQQNLLNNCTPHAQLSTRGNTADANPRYYTQYGHTWGILHYYNYYYNTVSQKNVPPLACYNFDAHKWILIFLAQMLRLKQAIKRRFTMPPQITWQNAETRKSHFTQLDCVTHTMHLCAIFLKENIVIYDVSDSI